MTSKTLYIKTFYAKQTYIVNQAKGQTRIGQIKVSIGHWHVLKLLPGAWHYRLPVDHIRITIRYLRVTIG